MGDKSDIEWTDASWNPIIGCFLKSSGCRNCYAMFVARRIAKMEHGKRYEGLVNTLGSGRPVWNGEIKLVEEVLEKPAQWKRPRKIFVNSMGDLFYESVPFEWIARVWDVMVKNTHHTFQILTKRPEVAASYASKLEWPDHIWIGTSVENDEVAADRISALCHIPAKTRFLSCEPMIGRVDPLRILRTIDPKTKEYPISWVIIGGESGQGARKMELSWAMDLYYYLTNHSDGKISVFVKQLGSVLSKELGLKHAKGGDVEEWPDKFRSLGNLRMFPEAQSSLF